MLERIWRFFSVRLVFRRGTEGWVVDDNVYLGSVMFLLRRTTVCVAVVVIVDVGEV